MSYLGMDSMAPLIWEMSQKLLSSGSIAHTAVMISRAAR
jgi:hypothetical protein